jgi:hypothetical protein
MLPLLSWLDSWGIPRTHNVIPKTGYNPYTQGVLGYFYTDGHLSAADAPLEDGNYGPPNFDFLSIPVEDAAAATPANSTLDLTKIPDAGGRGMVYDDTGDDLYIANMYDYVADGPTERLIGKEYLYASIDYRDWVSQQGSAVAKPPRSPLQAIQHIVRFLEFHPDNDVRWKDRGMDAVARAYGLQSSRCSEIPATIPGVTDSAARNFRWLREEHPEYVVQAPSSTTFGNSVPIGALLYWDESINGYGAVGIAAGYRNGVLQQFTVGEAKPQIPEHLPDGRTNPAYTKAQAAGLLETTHDIVLRDAPAAGCLGWSAPIFYASSTDGFNLWEV